MIEEDYLYVEVRDEDGKVAKKRSIICKRKMSIIARKTSDSTGPGS